MNWVSALRSPARVVRMTLSSWQKGRAQRVINLSAVLSWTMALIKAVAVATAFSVEGVAGKGVDGMRVVGMGVDRMGGVVWAGQDRETTRKRMKYRRDLFIDGTI